jgi:RNA polymerase sigma-70 factor (sigma-E family)
LTTAFIDTVPTRAEDGGTRVLQQDRDSFDAFVRARLPHLLRLGRALTGSEQAGADLVQDALERSLMRWSRIESEDPEGYVRRVMVTRNISAWRRVRRERLTADVPETSYDDPQADPALWAALTQLPPRQRAVIALRYYEDLTEAQTAHLLGISAGTVKSQASRAMAKLRELLADQEAAGQGVAERRTDERGGA